MPFYVILSNLRNKLMMWWWW